MEWKKEDLTSLRELESSVLRVWLNHEAEMNDYTAGRAYEAAFQFYRARWRGQEPKPPTLKGLDLEAFQAVQSTCEKLLTTGATPVKGISKGNTSPLGLEKLVEYLRELARSVERHTKRSGRCGYLELIRAHIP